MLLNKIVIFIRLDYLLRSTPSPPPIMLLETCFYAKVVLEIARVRTVGDQLFGPHLVVYKKSF